LTALKRKEMPLRPRTGTSFSINFFIFIFILYLASVLHVCICWSEVDQNKFA